MVMEVWIMRWKVHVANDLGVLDEDNRLVCMARTPQEATLIAAAPEMRDSILGLLGIVLNIHFDCDWQSDVKCRATYGNRNTGDHRILRNTVDAIRNAAREEDLSDASR